MSSQDMQFADPEWQPPEEREANTNPREQKTLPPRPINADRLDQPEWQTTASTPEQGYLGSGYAGSQPQTTWGGSSRPRPRRRGSPWLWIILAFIIIALMSGGFSRGFSNGGGPGPRENFREQPQSFTFKGIPTVVINGNNVGNITIQTDNSGVASDTVTFEATGNTGGPFGNPNDTQVQYTQSNNDSTVTATPEGGSVDFNVIVPSDTNLQLTTADGSIEVDGVTGQITLQSGSGDITAKGDTLADPSTLKSDSGSVTFNGSIGSGSYQFQSNSGSVDVTLPSTSNFQVNASTKAGSINSDFSSVNIQNQGNGSQAHGNVGNGGPSQAQVTLTSDSGGITLHKSS